MPSNFILNNRTFADSWFCADNKIYKMENAFENKNNVLIEAYALESINSFFDKPFDSKHLHIYAGNITKKETNLTVINVSNIKCKFVVINSPNNINEYVLIPLLHSIKQ